MDSLTIIVGALVAGAAAGATSVATDTVKDAYAGLKKLVVDRFGKKVAVESAVAQVEQKPESKPRKEMLKEELQDAGADKDAEIVQQAQALLDLLKKEGMLSEARYNVIVSGSGAAAVGRGSVAAGAGGVAAGIIYGDVHIGTASPEPSPASKPTTIKILFLAANPTDTLRLRLGDEVRSIDQALCQAEYRDAFDLEQAHAVRVSDLQGLLLRYQPHIVHFSGHGSEAGEIILEDEVGRSQPVSSQALTTVFSLLKDNIRCVVLNACFSEIQARAIAEHIDCVVGMSEAIGDRAAIDFAAAFYQALAYGRSVAAAFELGRSQIDLAGLDEQDTPQLLALHVDASQVAFARQ